MSRPRVLLSEASSLTAREFVTVLGRSGVDVEAVDGGAIPIARFSRWCKAVHRVPTASSDPAGYLAAIGELMGSGRFVALLPTHEQAWLFAAGRHLLPDVDLAVAPLSSFDQVVSKLSLAGVLDTLGIHQPQWRPVHTEDDLDALGYPVWVKAAFSTAGRGVRRAHNHADASAAWSELSAAELGPVMIQATAPGRYAQVQGLFDRGRLLAAAVSEQLADGAGGSAAARLSVDHPAAVEALGRLGRHLDWHGGLDLDYFHVDGEPQIIECNPRITEPGNAAAAGVNLPRLMIALTTGDDLPEQLMVTKAGARTRSTMAIALGAAEREGSRAAVARAVGNAVARRGRLHHSREVLTPVWHDPPSLLPFLVGTGTVLIRPNAIHHLTGDAVTSYGVTPAAIDQVRADPPAAPVGSRPTTA